MLELILGFVTIVTIAVVLGHGKDDLYDTTVAGACTAEDYDLA